MLALKICRDLTSEDLRRLARSESDGRGLPAPAGDRQDGVSREEAARQAGMDRQTLRDWVVRYNAEGGKAYGIGRAPAGCHPCWRAEQSWGTGDR